MASEEYKGSHTATLNSYGSTTIVVSKIWFLETGIQIHRVSLPLYLPWYLVYSHKVYLCFKEGGVSWWTSNQSRKGHSSHRHRSFSCDRSKTTSRSLFTRTTRAIGSGAASGWWSHYPGWCHGILYTITKKVIVLRMMQKSDCCQELQRLWSIESVWETCENLWKQNIIRWMFIVICNNCSQSKYKVKYYIGAAVHNLVHWTQFEKHIQVLGGKTIRWMFFLSFVTIVVSQNKVKYYFGVWKHHFQFFESKTTCGCSLSVVAIVVFHSTMLCNILCEMKNINKRYNWFHMNLIVAGVWEYTDVEICIVEWSSTFSWKRKLSIFLFAIIMCGGILYETNNFICAKFCLSYWK